MGNRKSIASFATARKEVHSATLFSFSASILFIIWKKKPQEKKG